MWMYNAAELGICMLFSFLVGFVIAKARPRNLLREALYKANPELKPAMTFTINDKLEIFWYRYEGMKISFLATVITEENRKPLEDWYRLPWPPEVGDYLQLVDGEAYSVNPEDFNKTYKRVLTD